MTQNITRTNQLRAEYIIFVLVSQRWHALVSTSMQNSRIHNKNFKIRGLLVLVLMMVVVVMVVTAALLLLLQVLVLYY